jgi:hypothetical protein
MHGFPKYPQHGVHSIDFCAILTIKEPGYSFLSKNKTGIVWHLLSLHFSRNNIYKQAE